MLNIEWKGIIHKCDDLHEGASLDCQLKFQSKITMIAWFIIGSMIGLGIFKFQILNKIEATRWYTLLLGELFALLIAFLIFIPLHEILHAICFPSKSKKQLYFYIGRPWHGEFSFILTSEIFVSKHRMIGLLLFPNLLMGVFPYLLWQVGIIDQFVLISKLFGFFVMILVIGFYADLNAIMQIMLQLPKHAKLSAQLSGFYYTLKHPTELIHEVEAE